MSILYNRGINLTPQAPITNMCPKSFKSTDKWSPECTEASSRDRSRRKNVGGHQEAHDGHHQLGGQRECFCGHARHRSFFLSFWLSWCPKGRLKGLNCKLRQEKEHYTTPPSPVSAYMAAYILRICPSCIPLLHPISPVELLREGSSAV